MKSVTCPHCNRDFQLRVNALLKRKCIICGVAIETSHATKLYCSNRCARLKPIRVQKRKEAYQRKRANPEYRLKWNKKASEYAAKRFKNDPVYRVKVNCRSRVRQLLKEHRLSHSILIGCTNKQLRAYIESMFYDGMTWKNYGVLWVIDHKRPISKFNLRDKDEIMKACHFTNLQPLTRQHNHEKSDSQDWVRRDSNPPVGQWNKAV